MPKIHPTEAMTKSKLIEMVAERTNITRSRAELVVNCLFQTMASALENRDGIEIRGFGSFTLKDYDGYVGRNPLKRVAIEVKPKTLPRFKVGKELKATIMGEGANLDHDDDDEDDDEE